MNIVLLMALGLSVGPLALAGGIRFLLMRGTVPLDRRVAVLTAIAGLIPAMGAIPRLFVPWFPGTALNSDLGFRAATPLVLGVVALSMLMIPGPRARTSGVAALARRRIGQFVSRRWTWTLLVLTALVLILTIAAGSVSSRDENGHYTMYWASMGTTTFGTNIYGWYFSTPSLIALALLLVMLFAALQVIASRAWDDDVEADGALRRLRSTNVIRIGCGATLIHLSVILQSLAGTSALRGQSTTTELGTVAMGTPFAALQPVLFWTGTAAFVVGLTICLITALIAIPVRSSMTAMRS
jgi:uncharacterized membrane protein